MSLTGSLVEPLSGRGPDSAGLFVPNTVAYDLALGGLPFVAYVDDQHPFRVGTAQLRKSQVDTSNEPGEQALDPFWWIRSQRTYSGGAGTKYADPKQGVEFDFFYQSRGVDVWTEGQLQLLRDTESPVTCNGKVGIPVLHYGVQAAVVANGASIIIQPLGGTSVTMTTTETVIGLASDGTTIFAATGVALYKCLITASAGAMTKMFNWSASVTTCPLAWVKQRLIAGPGRAVHTYNGTESTPMATPVYTHPSIDWAWVGFAESGDSIYAAGYAGSAGSVMAIRASSTDGTLPTLTSATVAAGLPNGEVPRAVCGYLGRLAIGTNRGLRIAEVGSSQIQYGPLLYEVSGGVRGMAGWDRFIYAAGNPHNPAGLVRVDLSKYTSDGRYPYAPDLEYVGSDTATYSVMAFGDGRIGFVTDARLAVLKTTRYVVSGWLQTSWVRFSTAGQKWFERISVRADTLLGGLSVASVTLAGTETSVYTSVDEGVIAVDTAASPAGNPVEAAAVKLTLTRGGPMASPTFYTWSLMALPVVPRSRVYEFTVKLLAEEWDANGQRWAASPVERMNAVWELEDAGRPVLLQLLRAGGPVRTEMVTVESVQLSRTAQGGWSDPDAGGGLLTFQLRTVPSAQG